MLIKVGLTVLLAAMMMISLAAVQAQQNMQDTTAVLPSANATASATTAPLMPPLTAENVPYMELPAELSGHTGQVTSVAISPDGKLLASGSEDKTVRLWSFPDGKSIATLQGHTDWVFAVAISPDGRLLASGGRDKTVRLWSLPDGKPVATLQGHASFVFTIAISPDGKLLASGANDNTVRIWSLPDGKPVATLQGHKGKVLRVAFRPDGKLLASAGGEGAIRLWSMPYGKPLATLEKTAWKGKPIFGLAISPNGKLLAATASGLALWSLPDGKPLANPSWKLPKEMGSNSDVIQSIAISPDGKLLATAYDVPWFGFGTLPDGQPITLISMPDLVNSLTFSPDGRYLVLGCANKTIYIGKAGGN